MSLNITVISNDCGHNLISVFGHAENIILLWHIKEIPSQRVPLWKAEDNNELEFTWTVLIFRGLSCGQSEIVVLAFSVFKRMIFIIPARNQDPPRDNGAKHNDPQVRILLPRQPLPSYNSYTEFNPASRHLIHIFRLYEMQYVLTNLNCKIPCCMVAQHYDSCVKYDAAIPGEGVQAQLCDLSQPPIRAMNLQLD